MGLDIDNWGLLIFKYIFPRLFYMTIIFKINHIYYLFCAELKKLFFF